MPNKPRRHTVLVPTILAVLLLPCLAAAESESVPFDSDRWVRPAAQIVERGGRTCLFGSASLRDVEFADGTIEVDLLADHGRSYPGIYFRMQDPDNSEHVYVRPHRAGHYSDAVQYASRFNGIGGWQLFNGTGYTAPVELPVDEWVPLKLEVRGHQARFYVGDLDRPVLEIDDLRHGASKGGIALEAQPNTCFSNFRYTLGGDLQFDAPPPPDVRPGMITDWELSQRFVVSDVDIERHPAEQQLPLEWRAVQADAGGMVDVSVYTGRSGREPDVVYARATIRSPKAEVKEYKIGYSDAVAVFLNGQILFSGSSAYQQRDQSALGIIGLFDSVYLPLKEGDNELLLAVVESFGGWAFMAQEAGVVFERAGLGKAWETEKEFLIPESVIHDPVRDVLYVTNFDVFGKSPAEVRQCVSKLAMDGTVLEPRWITGLNRPTGMVVSGDTLYVVERGAVVRVDLAAGEIAERLPLAGAAFPNDVALDEAGRLYVSDSARGTILRRAEGEFEPWVGPPAILAPNGLFVQGGELFVGDNGDNRLKAVDLRTSAVRTVAKLGPGTIDGLQSDGRGNLVVSHWEGRLLRISPDGAVEKLLDTTDPGQYLADFEYVPGQDLIVVPTFFGNRVVAYRLTP